MRDEPGQLSTAEDDPRITRIGKFLRKYKFDEIPNLFNLLRGDMALIGPRTTLSSVLDTISQADMDIILSVKPGLFDCGGLWNYNEEERLKGAEDPHGRFIEEIYPELVKRQIECINHRSLGHDLKVIVRVVWKIIRK